MKPGRLRSLLQSLRERFLLVVLSRLVWLVGQMLCRSLRLQVTGEHNLDSIPSGQGKILVTWHHLSLLPVFYLRRRGMRALISLSRDGEYQNRIFRHFGWGSVRGSSGRGQLGALREATRFLRHGGTMALTPDGPLGPRMQCQPGCVYMALSSGAPIVPIAVHFQPHFHLPTWDRYSLPRPFARAHLHFGAPIRFSGNHHSIDLEAACGQIANALNDAVAEAKSGVEQAGAHATREGEPAGEPARKAQAGPPLLPWLLYNCALAALFPLLLLYLFRNYLTRARARPGLLQRLGLAPPFAADRTDLERVVWMHAVSVGEVAAVRPVVQALKEYGAVPMAVSVTTATGHAVAEKDLAGLADCLFYFPLDFPFCVGRALDAVRPHAVVLAEGEIWPNLLHECRRRGILAVLVNGRVSARTAARSSFIAPLYGWALSNLDLLCMQTPRDCRRVQALGADPAIIKDTGNTKFDTLQATVPEAVRRQLLLELRLTPDHKILLAGSTHAGEEEQILDAFWHARVQIPELRLLLVPRQVERAAEVERLIASKGFHCVRRTQMPKGITVADTIERLAAGEDDPERVVLIDTMGELASLYSICTVAFVGSSLTPGGGQNPLEPMAEGKPVLFGPSMTDFQGPRDLAVEAEVGFEVRNADEIAETLVRLCRNPARLEQIAAKAHALVTENKGASARCAGYLMRLLQEVEKPA